MEGPFDPWLYESSKMAIPYSLMVGHATVEMVFAVKVLCGDCPGKCHRYLSERYWNSLRSFKFRRGNSVDGASVSKSSMDRGSRVRKSMTGQTKYRAIVLQQDTVTGASVK